MAAGGSPSAWRRALWPAGVPRADLVAFWALATLCFASFNQLDLAYTATQATALLAGHVRDFYDFNHTVVGPANYLPATYLVFALWTAPLVALGVLPTAGAGVVTGFALGWCKLLTTLAYLATGAVLHRLAVRSGLSERTAGLVTFAWLTSPLAFFSQFVFGQYDVFNVLCLVVALACWVEGRLLAFTVACAAAMTFKNFAVFAWVPLVLLREKRPGVLAAHALALLLPSALLAAPFWTSAAFQQDVVGFAQNRRVLALTLDLGAWRASVVFLAWFAGCGWAYLTERPAWPPRVARDHAMHTAFAVFALVLGLILWHPQWTMLLAAPWAVLALTARRASFFLLLELAAAVAVMVVSVRVFRFNVDQMLLATGVWAQVVPALRDTRLVHPILDTPFFGLGPTEVWAALFDATLLIVAVSRVPGLRTRPWSARDADVTWPEVAAAMRARLWVGVAWMVVPCAYAIVRTIGRAAP